MSEKLSLGATDMELGRIGFSEEQADLLEVAANFCRDKSPIEQVRRMMTTPQGYDKSVWKEIVDLGWLAIAIPGEYGGVGLTLAEVVPVVEQMGVSLLATPFLSSTLAAQTILVGGTPAQKRDLLPKIVAGEVATLAVIDGTGNWDLSDTDATASQGMRAQLKGEKLLACDATQARWIIVSVMRGGKPALAIVARDAFSEGAIRRETIIDETKRSYALRLDGIEIESSMFLDDDHIEATLRHIHLASSLLSAAECCGGAKAVIDYTVDYLRTRKQFGRLIGSFQALKHPAVDAYVSYEKARSHLYSAAHCFSDQGTGEIATHMAKVTADKALSYAADRSIQFHGGFGFTYDCDAQLYRRRAAWHAALYGDAAYHKKRLAALLF